jgi:hypothetical protein
VLALEPAAVRLRDVVGARREDVEDEPAAGHEQLVRRSQRLEPRVVVAEMQVRPERTRHEGHALCDRRRRQIADPQV